jgi:hypothetical protein
MQADAVWKPAACTNNGKRQNQRSGSQVVRWHSVHAPFVALSRRPQDLQKKCSVYKCSSHFPATYAEFCCRRWISSQCSLATCRNMCRPISEMSCIVRFTLYEYPVSFSRDVPREYTLPCCLLGCWTAWFGRSLSSFRSNVQGRPADGNHCLRFSCSL